MAHNKRNRRNPLGAWHLFRAVVAGLATRITLSEAIFLANQVQIGL